METAQEELARNVLAQANFRVRIGLVMAAVVVGIHLFGPYQSGASPLLPLGVAAGYVVYTAVARYFSGRPAPLTHRDVVMITAVVDPLFYSAWLFAAGESSVLFVALYLFTVLGFGFRVGAVPMHVCQVMSLIGFTLVASTSPVWRENVLFALSHMVLLAIVPLYASFLIARIQNARALAEHESRAKSQLLAKVSHELRTPLTGISAAAQLLEVESAEPATVARAHSILHLSSSLDSEIKQLLDLSKIEVRGHLRRDEPPASYSVARAMASAFQSLESIAAGKPIRARLELDPAIRLPVLGHHDNLVAVLTNLAGNAVKFTDRGSVTLEARLLDETGDRYRMRFAVIDTGIGIPLEFQARIFDPFFQVSAGAQKSRGGTGLGTTIARELVSRMGGRLEVDSAPGEGSSFHFVLDLPVDRNATGSDAAAAPAAAATIEVVTGKRVLIADDNQTNLELLREMLLKDGHQVTTVDGGRDALAALAANTFDVVFLDYNMGDVDGATVFQTYQFGRVDTAPVFFVTADATPLTRRTLEETGGAGVINKPVTFARIREAMLQVFPGQATRRVAIPSPAGSPAPRRTPELAAVPVEYFSPDVIDMLREIKDSDEFVCQVLGDGLADIEKLERQMLPAIAAQDLGQVHRLAHAIKGVALNIGGVRLVALADRLMTISAEALASDPARWQQELAATSRSTRLAVDRERRARGPAKAAGR
jgi:two-component system sensor histidine kinase RpfC